MEDDLGSACGVRSRTGEGRALPFPRALLIAAGLSETVLGPPASALLRVH
jgi:hypothetical protein